MGVGKAAIAVIMIGVLAFAMVAGASMAYHDKSPDLFYNNGTTANGTIQLTSTIMNTSSNMLTPLIALSGLLLLLASFLVLTRRR